MRHFCRFQCELVARGCWLVQRFGTKIQETLLRCQVAEKLLRRLDRRRVQQSMFAQHHGGVSQQVHVPSQPQAVEKAQWVFLIRLCQIDPRAHLLEQALSRDAGQGHQPEQNSVAARSKGEFSFASQCSPAALAKGRLATDAKPMAIFKRSIFQPVQWLTLRTLGAVPDHIGRHQIHVGYHFNDTCHSSVFPKSNLGFGGQIAKVSNHDLWPSRPKLLKVVKAGHQASTFGEIGRSGPTHERHEHHRGGSFTPPQPERVLLLANEPTALPGLKCGYRARLDGTCSFEFLFFEKTELRRQISRVNESHRMGPTGRPFDPRQPQLVVDGSETCYSCPCTRLLKHPYILPAMTIKSMLQ